MIEPGQERGEEPRLDAQNIEDLTPREDESAELKGGEGCKVSTGRPQ